MDIIRHFLPILIICLFSCIQILKFDITLLTVIISRNSSDKLTCYLQKSIENRFAMGFLHS